MYKFMSEIVAEIQFLTGRRPMRSYSAGTLATIALRKSAPMLFTAIIETGRCWNRPIDQPA